MTTPTEHTHPPYPPGHFDYRLERPAGHRHDHPRGDWHHTHDGGIAGDYTAANAPPPASR